MTAKILNFPGGKLVPEALPPVDDLASEPTPERLAQALRSGEVPSDRVFDRFLPHDLDVLSGQYWTPLIVAARAAEWFTELGVRTVVDIGSGAGKFCVAAALYGGASYIGLEQRPRLVAVARALCSLFQVEDRARFIEGALGDSALPSADAYYLYNPFGENLFGTADHLDENVELSDERYVRDIRAAEDLMRAAPAGTYVLTYNGFGGQVPASYDRLRSDYNLPEVLRLWRKTGALNR